MKAELVGPNTNHTPSVKEDDTDGNRVEHGLGSQAEALLDVPKGVDSKGLNSNVISGNERKKSLLDESRLTCAAIPTMRRYVS